MRLLIIDVFADLIWGLVKLILLLGLVFTLVFIIIASSNILRKKSKLLFFTVIGSVLILSFNIEIDGYRLWERLLVFGAAIAGLSALCVRITSKKEPPVIEKKEYVEHVSIKPSYNYRSGGGGSNQVVSQIKKTPHEQFVEENYLSPVDLSRIEVYKCHYLTTSCQTCEFSDDYYCTRLDRSINADDCCDYYEKSIMHGD